MNNLIENLKCVSYIEMDVGKPGVRVIYKADGKKAWVVSFVDHEETGFSGEEEYRELQIECRDLFLHTSFSECEYLMIVSGNDINELRKHLLNISGYWMVNKETRRLIIYENQPNSFNNMERIVDEYLYGVDGRILDETVDLDSHPLSKEEIKAINKRLQPTFLQKNSWMDYPIITYMIVAANVIIYFFTTAGYKGDSLGRYLCQVGGLCASYIQEPGDYIRLFTSMFLHANFEHMFTNMFCLVIYGYYLEAYIGKLRFLLLYMIGGLGSSVCELIHYVNNDLNNVGVGASGALYAVIGGAIVLSILHEDLRKVFSPLILIVVIIFSLLDGFFSTENIGNIAHIGGLLIGMVLTFVVDNVLSAYKRKKGIT